MAKFNKGRQIQNSRRKLMARWFDNKGQNMRSKLMAALYDHKALPNEVVTDLMNDQGSLPRVDLRCINLSGKSLDGIDLSRANLQGANLARSSFRTAKLVEADLRDTLLRNTNLTGADLRGANLAGAIMENTILHGAQLDNAHLTHSTIITGTTELPASMRRAEGLPWFADRLPSPKTDTGEE